MLFAVHFDFLSPPISLPRDCAGFEVRAVEGGVLSRGVSLVVVGNVERRVEMGLGLTDAIYHLTPLGPPPTRGR